MVQRKTINKKVQNISLASAKEIEEENEDSNNNNTAQRKRNLHGKKLNKYVTN